MSVPVRYHCPRCGTIATLTRDAYLADKSVTATPLKGWQYANPDEPFEEADGVRLICGEHGDDDGCGETFYLNFVRFENGEAVEPGRERSTVRIADPTTLSQPQSPQEPPGPAAGGE